MISDFQELADKIEQLAELTHHLRRENAQLRQANAALVTENISYQHRLGEAHQRVSALLVKISPPEPAPDPDTEEMEAVKEDVQ